MIFSTVVLIASTALFFFYLQAICQKTLGREFAQPYFQAVVNAYRLRFPALLNPIGARRDGAPLRTALRVDFAVLNCLLRETANGRERSPRGERLLKAAFRALLFSLAVREAFGLSRQKTCQRMTTVLQYFANLVGERLQASSLAVATPSEYISSL